VVDLKPPKMKDVTVEELLGGRLPSVVADHRRQMVLHRVKSFLVGCAAWVVIAIFFIGLATVLQLGK